jgi:hypothetical protein
LKDFAAAGFCSPRAAGFSLFDGCEIFRGPKPADAESFAVLVFQINRGLTKTNK